MMIYQRRLCVPRVDTVPERIMKEAHSSIYSIHLGSKMMYHNFREVYWLEGVKKDIVEFVARCPKF